ncbi:MAG TPA: zinc-ribbon domain-containing protein [Isosphaeraceae bacterium]|jgi:hypothetical protein|nr:zinc-ribbon domain-containing protein [Isosphaeraceae bacterium]
MLAEDWDEDGLNDDDDNDHSGVVPCPSCGAEVYDDAEQCPACGDHIVHPTNQWYGKPWWWVVLGLLGIAAVIWVSLP